MVHPSDGLLPSHKKINKILMHATKWMNLKHIRLSERSQTHNDPLIQNIQNWQIYRHRSGLVVTGSWERGNEECLQLDTILGVSG